MFDYERNREMEAALRGGLQSLPAPELSRDFNARVLAAVARARPWWPRLFRAARPTLSGAAISLAICLALLPRYVQAPIYAPPSRATLASREAGMSYSDYPDPASWNSTAEQLVYGQRKRAAAATAEPSPPPAEPPVRRSDSRITFPS
jgi:hypothetical protein